MYTKGDNPFWPIDSLKFLKRYRFKMSNVQVKLVDDEVSLLNLMITGLDKMV